MNQTLISLQRYNLKKFVLVSYIEVYYICLAVAVLLKVAFHIYQFRVFYKLILVKLLKQFYNGLKESSLYFSKRRRSSLSQKEQVKTLNSGHNKRLNTQNQRPPKKQAKSTKSSKFKRKYFNRYSDNGTHNNYKSNIDLSSKQNEHHSCSQNNLKGQ
jgi:hypothetical protein